MAVEVGVTYKPDVVIHKRQPEDQWLIVASDGVWELVSSQVADYTALDCFPVVNVNCKGWLEKHQ